MGALASKLLRSCCLRSGLSILPEKVYGFLTGYFVGRLLMVVIPVCTCCMFVTLCPVIAWSSVILWNVPDPLSPVDVFGRLMSY